MASTENTHRRIAVIGGGLAGLAAAHRLTELAPTTNQPIDITLFEAGARLGGLVGTEQIDGYLVDVGADSFLTNKPAAVGLCRRLGIENRLIPTEPRYRGALVLHQGRPVPVPDGFQLLSPTAIWPILTSPLFSTWGKLRLLMEWTVPRHAHAQGQTPSGDQPTALVDESLADFARRRFGREAFERLIQPLVGGIYTADPERLSLAATMPRFLEMERDYGSLIRAVFAQKAKDRKRQKWTDGQKSDSLESGERSMSSGARYGLFAGLEGGMIDLVRALQSQVESRCQIRLNTRVTFVSTGNIPHSNDVTADPGGYRLALDDDSEQNFDSVIVASTAATTAKILETLDPALSAELRDIEYASSALVVTGHRLSDIRHPLDSFGLVIPQIEHRRILAVSFSSRKFPNRAPEGHVLLRTFVGGALQPELLKLDDDQLRDLVRDELRDIFGVGGTPDFTRVYRYERAMPQYTLGHLERIARIDQRIQQRPGLELAGIAYHGVGVPDVIANAEHAAESLISKRSPRARAH
ncbi:protoporphyrinogen oxidase [Schlesneria paludicola]|uniref:protoporphyrinogen oxidase n=1 Tax=Schlesneria paludicola TaxID=360056 RepID=UPI00029A5133|nr:protoporphyrinogen oxidase [Schlesneria paludicola]